MKFRFSYLIMLGLLVCCIAIVVSSHNASARVANWDGGGADNLASTKENWDGPDIAPIAGDTIVINSGSKACTWDLGLTFVGFYMNSSYTGTLTVSSSFGCSVFSTLSGGTFNGGTGPVVTCSGDVTCTSSFTSYTTSFTLTGNSKTFYVTTSSHKTLTNNGNYKIRSSGSFLTFKNLVNTGTLDISQLGVSVYIDNSANSFSNTGYIIGGGLLRLHIINVAYNFTPGVINCSLHIVGYSLSANRVVTLQSNSNLGALSIYQDSNTYSLTLDLNSKNLNVKVLSLGCKGSVKNSGGTYSWLHSTGGFVNSSNSVGLIVSGIYYSWSDWQPHISEMPDTVSDLMGSYSQDVAWNETVVSKTFVGPSWLSYSNNVVSGSPVDIGYYDCWLNATSQNGTLAQSYHWVITVSGAVVATDYNPMWIWLVFLFALTIITYVGYRRLPLLSLVSMVSTLLVAVASVSAFGDLWMIPFVLVLVNVVIATLALVRR